MTGMVETKVYPRAEPMPARLRQDASSTGSPDHPAAAGGPRQGRVTAECAGSPVNPAPRSFVSIRSFQMLADAVLQGIQIRNRNPLGGESDLNSSAASLRSTIEPFAGPNASSVLFISS